MLYLTSVMANVVRAQSYQRGKTLHVALHISFRRAAVERGMEICLLYPVRSSNGVGAEVKTGSNPVPHQLVAQHLWLRHALNPAGISNGISHKKYHGRGTGLEANSIYKCFASF